MLDYLGIFREFNKKRIKYIVTGGIAINLHGIPRATYDIGLLLKMEADNLRKFLGLLKNWGFTPLDSKHLTGFKPKVPVDIMDFSKRENRERWIKEKNMKAFNLYNDKWAISEIDILIDIPVDYNQASKSVVYKKSEDVIIPVISIDNLIKMKSESKRAQDLSDIEHLKKKL